MASDEKKPQSSEPKAKGEEEAPPPAAEGDAAMSERDSQSAEVKEDAKEAATEKNNVTKDRKRNPELMEEVEPDGDAVTPRERPSRERKTVDRFTSPVSRSSAGKPLSIEKGSGTPLREIPNVAFKLSKRKPDGNLQLLHTILYGRKAKVHNLKKDIGHFSGFVWADSEEKQRAKTKEKIDKCVKEKLLDFCDVLNIPINKSTIKKEDLTVNLLKFLESPHATSEDLLADKNQKVKSKKGKATSTKSRTSKGTSAEKSAKKTQSGKKRKRTSKAEEENETDDIDDNLESQSHSSEEEEEKDEVEKHESDNEDTASEEEKEETKKKITTSKTSKDNSSGAKSRKQSMNTDKRSTEKSAKSSAKSEKKATVASKKSGTADVSASSSKTKASAGKKQKVEEEMEKEKQVPVDDKSRSKKQGSKPASKEQGKIKTSKEAKREPTNEELHAQAENILKEVDFNTATLSDILKLLGTHFGLDLMHRKVEVKAIITDVIENMSNSDEDEEEEEEEDSDAE